MSSRRSTPVLFVSAIVGGLAAAGLLLDSSAGAAQTAAPAFDPLLSDPSAFCGAPVSNRKLLAAWTQAAAKSENAPFQPPPMKAAGGQVPLYDNLGKLHLKVSTTNPQAQAYFDQGVRLSFAFNHAEAQRAFQSAQVLDPDCAMCYWGEALVLGPNINAPMPPEANEPALAALAKATALAAKASAKERALIAALEKRYSADPKAERATLDAAYADAMQTVAKRFAADDTVQVLYAEAAMDTQPWDYWQAAGAKPKGRTADFVRALETVLKRNPSHPGAIHLYIHAVEASNRPERALPHAKRLGQLMPGAGHIVHMPAHIYYRVGQYREALETNKVAIAADERYFETSPSDPLYKAGYYPHNIHFLLVSAQMGGDGPTALDAAAKLDGTMPMDIVKQFALLEPVKAAPYATHALFSDPQTILALPAPSVELPLLTATYHYARAVASAAKKDADAAQQEIAALEKIAATADFKPYEAWQVPAKEIVLTARHVAEGRLADARGDLVAAAQAYERAIAIEDALAYMEPPYWYYPIRQSLGSVRLRQGNLDAAEKAFRDSLARVRNNGWALAGLVEVYRRKGQAKSEAAARKAFVQAWFGPDRGPDLSRL